MSSVKNTNLDPSTYFAIKQKRNGKRNLKYPISTKRKFHHLYRFSDYYRIPVLSIKQILEETREKGPA